MARRLAETSAPSARAIAHSVEEARFAAIRGSSPDRSPPKRNAYEPVTAAERYKGMVRLLDRAKQWAKTVKRDVVALWIAARDPRTPVMAKIVAGAVAAYALSPIDLIPDFIPVIGYFDDLLIVPFGILLAVSMIPDELMLEFRNQAAARIGRPASNAGLLAIVGIWAVCVAVIGWLIWR